MKSILLESSSNIRLEFAFRKWFVPNGFLGLWSLQSLDFQKEHDIFTTEGLLAFLGWYIQTEEEQLRLHHYIARYFLYELETLPEILAENITNDSKLYIPLAFYCIYLSRPDLKQAFDVSTLEGRNLFFEWLFFSGYEYFSSRLLCREVQRRLPSLYSHFQWEGQPLLNKYFLELLACMKAPEFDEKWYLNQYPDVKADVLAGGLKSAQDHWLRYGQLEGRQPAEISLDFFDEEWYFKRYPDIESSLATGLFSSAQEHWLCSGKDEGRLPAPLPIELVNFDLSLCAAV